VTYQDDKDVSPDLEKQKMYSIAPESVTMRPTATPVARGGDYMRILLADDHDLVREAIAQFLRHEGFEEVVCVPSLQAGLDAVRQGGSFDLVLLDYDMPGMNGLEGLARMRNAVEGRPVALLTGTTSAALAGDAIAAGASGYVPKTLGAKSMVSAVRFMAAGETFVPFEFMRQTATPTVGNLTERETQVLHGLCAGKSNKEIARDLDLQEVTIKLHVKTLCRKLEAKNRTQAAMIAKERRLV
jgi:two-component system nitrate/nitrite response regulator NarL